MLTGYDVDLIFRWPRGRAERMARRGRLTHFLLPDGSIRFDQEEIKGLVQRVESGVDGQKSIQADAGEAADRRPAST
jgi:hypothetical protein